MAIKLEDKPGVQAPNVAYPFGRPKDNSGSNDGMPLNVLTHGDFHQFFAKMMAESGIVYNDQPDNATDGFQYWLALVEAIESNSGNYSAISGITAGAGISISFLDAREYRNGKIMISAVLTFSANISANTNILSNIPNAFLQSFTGYTAFGSTKVEVGLYAAATHISNPYGVISSLGSPTQFAFYLEYQKV